MPFCRLTFPLIFFANNVFSILVQLTFAKNINCTPLSSHSAKQQQRPRIIAALSPIAQATLVSDRWSVVLRLSVCPVPTICWKSVCRKNFKFTGDIMQTWVTGTLIGSMNEWWLLGANLARTCCNYVNVNRNFGLSLGLKHLALAWPRSRCLIM